MRVPLKWLAISHAVAFGIWILADIPPDRPRPDMHDDAFASWGLPMLVGTIPALALGAAGGWLIDTVPKVALGMVVAATLGVVVLMAGSIFLSGELFFCSPCDPATAQESLAAAVAAQMLLLVFWGGWAAASAIRARREGR